MTGQRRRNAYEYHYWVVLKKQTAIIWQTRTKKAVWIMFQSQWFHQAFSKMGSALQWQGLSCNLRNKDIRLSNTAIVWRKCIIAHNTGVWVTSVWAASSADQQTEVGFGRTHCYEMSLASCIVALKTLVTSSTDNNDTQGFVQVFKPILKQYLHAYTLRYWFCLTYLCLYYREETA